MPPITLYVLYNADASILGKARYSYRKLTRSKAGEPECAACDITHGGLSLQETPSWTAAKKEIETQPETRVVQWHRDELSPTVKSYMEEQKLSYPVVLYETDGILKTAMNKTELASYAGDADIFVKALRSKHILPEIPESHL